MASDGGGLCNARMKVIALELFFFELFQVADQWPLF